MSKSDVKTHAKTQKLTQLFAWLKRRWVAISLLVVCLLVFNFFTGLISYGFTWTRCMRQPVTASRFMAGYQYYVPGNQGYGPDMFAEYYCTEADARAAGFQPGL